MANPNVGEILAAQQMEMQQKAAAAAAALQAAGTQTTEGTETVNPLIGLTAPPTLSTVPAQ